MSIAVQILRIPGLLVGIITMLGLIMLKKPLNKIFYGTIKTILGFLILTLGVEIIINSLEIFESLFMEAFQVKGIYFDDNIVAGKMMAEKGDLIGVIMLLGFLTHLLIARFTRIKWIYLTGHKIWHLSAILVLVFLSVDVPEFKLIIFSAVILGVFMSIQPFILQPWIRKVTGNDNFGMGHTIGLLVIMSSVIAKITGKSPGKIKRDDDYNQTELIEHLSISLSFIIFLMFLLPALFIDKPVLIEITSSQYPLVYIFRQSLQVTAGIIIVLKGVEMFLTELIPAFEGIANRIVPDAKPALDVPVFFSYSPLGVNIGLISSFLGWTSATYLAKLFALPVIPIPSMMGIMFGGTIVGVFGFAAGGKRGAIISGFVCGAVWPLFISVLYPLINLSNYKITGSGILTPDLYLIIIIVKFIEKAFLGY